MSNYLPHILTVKSHEGILFFARPKFEDLGRFLFAKTISGWESLSILQPKENEVIVDIGANTGYYTIHLSPKVGKKGIVIAVEPHPETFNLLKRNCELNHLSNVKFYNYAITESIGKVNFSNSGIHSGTNSIFSSHAYSNQKDIVVESTTLDELLGEEYQTIDWLKIDVEGSELAVLKGSNKTLNRTKKILVEVHEHILNENNENVQDIIDILKKNNFKIRTFNNHWDKKISSNQTLKSDQIFGEKEI